MENFDLKHILVEWSYRVDRGYPNVNKVEDRTVLFNILRENYGSDVAKEYMENIEKSLDEVALGLNNSSLRHENEHERYNKKLIQIFKTGGEAVMERDVTYVDESEDETSTITIPAKADVKIDNEDEIIGKLIAALRGVLKYGPDFPDDSEKAQKALRIAEKTFTYDDGSYKRVVPVHYKGQKVLIKLNDLSKDTVTGRKEKEDEEQPSADQPQKKKPSEPKPETGPEPETVSELDEDISVVKQLSELTYQNSEEKEKKYSKILKKKKKKSVTEDDDDKPSKYADRRDDGKDERHPDREYSDEPEGAAATDRDDEENGSEDEEQQDGEEVEELEEARSAPDGVRVSDFEKSVRNHIASMFSDRGVSPQSGNAKLQVDELDDDLKNSIANEIVDFITSSYEVELVHGPTISKNTKNVNWISDDYEFSDIDSSMYHVFVGLKNPNDETVSVFYWKLSTSSAGGKAGPKAEDYEIGICSAYYAFKDRSEENPFYSDGEIDPTADFDVNQIEGYVDQATDNASTGTYNAAAKTIAVGLSVIKRNTELQSDGLDLKWFGSGSVQTSSKYTGSDTTPKTDLYSNKNLYNFSLKKSGKSQLMSGQKSEVKAVLEAAIEFFDDELDSSESSKKEEIANSIISDFENKFETISRDYYIEEDGESKLASITDLREIAKNAYFRFREPELERELQDLIGDDESVTVDAFDGSEITITFDTIDNVIENHITGEWKEHGAGTQQGSWEDDIIQSLFISRERFTDVVNRGFSNSDLEPVDDKVKEVVGRLLDHRIVTDKFKKLVENKAFSKWIVLEASTGLYKFDGTASSDIDTILNTNISRPVANRYFVFDADISTSSSDKIQPITKRWAESKSDNVGLRVNFKTRKKTFNSALRAENMEYDKSVSSSSLIQRIVLNEKEKMMDNIKYELNNNILTEGFVDDLKDYAKRVKDWFIEMGSVIYEQFKKFLKRTLDKIKNVVNLLLEKGLKAFMDNLGIEIDMEKTELSIQPFII